MTRHLLSPCVVLLVLSPLARALQAPCGTEVVHEDLTLTLEGPRLLSPDGAAVVGGPISFQIVDGRPNEFGILFYGPEAPFVDRDLLDVLVPGPPYYILSFFTDAEGRSPVLLGGPELDPYLCGERVAIQGAVLDPAAPGGVALTNSIRIHVGEATRPVFPMPAYFLPDPAIPQRGPLAVADFDGDGVADIVLGDGSPGAVYVLDGDSGRELTARSVSAGVGARTVFAHELTGDGIVDIAYLRSDPFTDEIFIGVLPGNGDGTFAAHVETTTMQTGRAVSTMPFATFFSDFGDFDTDGNADLIVAQESTESLLMLGRGDGTFEPPFVVGPAVHTGGSLDVRAVDLDHDGNDDFITLGTDRFSVTLGNGDGTFGPTDVVQVPVTPSGVPANFGFQYEPGDFNGDGDLDLSNGAYVVLGNGDGTFGTPREAQMGAALQGLVFVGDFDRDGADDALDESGIVLVSGGEHTFSPRSTGLTASSMRAGDFDGDGFQDFVFDRTGGGSGAVYIAYGDEYWPRVSRYFPTLASNPDQMVVEDVDGDGNNDVIVVNLGAGTTNSGAVTVHRGSPDGTLGEPEPLVFGINPFCVDTGDVDGDGDRDLAIFHFADPKFRVILASDGAGGFGTPAYEAGWDVTEAEFADMDGDGALDVVGTLAPGVRIAHGDGTGGFVPVSSADSYSVSGNPGDVWIADLNEDGLLDVATIDQYSEGLATLLTDGAGNLVAGMPMPLATMPRDLVGADFDEDGHLDFAVRFEPRGQKGAAFALGGGDGTFGAALPILPGEDVLALDACDFDGDGNVDLSLYALGRIGVLLGDGGGMFASPRWFRCGSSRELASGDLDRDGIPDLLSAPGNAQVPSGSFGVGIEVFLNVLGEGDAPEPCVIRPRSAAEAGVAKTFDATRSSDAGPVIVGYAWDFGDGATGVGPTPEHTYSDVGEYVVKLVTTGTFGDAYTCSYIQQVVQAICSFTVTTFFGQIVLDASASSGAIQSYFWDFGNGNTLSTLSPIVSPGYAPGTYTATLTVTDVLGVMTSCSQTVVVP